MHAKCLIAKPIAEKDENIYCNHVVVPNFVPIVCSTLKEKSVYIPTHKRNQKVERKALKPKPSWATKVHLVCMWDAWPLHEQALKGQSV